MLKLNLIVNDHLNLNLKKTANTKENIQQYMWDEICVFRPEMKDKTWKRDNKPNNNNNNNNNNTTNNTSTTTTTTAK